MFGACSKFCPLKPGYFTFGLKTFAWVSNSLTMFSSSPRHLSTIVDCSIWNYKSECRLFNFGIINPSKYERCKGRILREDGRPLFRRSEIDTAFGQFVELFLISKASRTVGRGFGRNETFFIRNSEEGTINRKIEVKLRKVVKETCPHARNFFTHLGLLISLA